MVSKNTCKIQVAESQFSDRHMVSAGHHLAADAAREILDAGGNAADAGGNAADAGGNAADAGVCGGVCLAVLLSEYVNFAGVAPIIYRHFETGEVTTISGLGWWPQKTSLAVIQRDYGGKIPLGILRTVIPGAPDAWISALERFGTMTFGEVADAAIRFARQGFAVTELSAEIYAAEADELRRWPENERIYLPKGRPPRAGETLVLRDLADSLQYMADQETSAAKKGRAAGLQAVRAAFYQGDIARKILRYHSQNNGWLTEDDLKDFRVEIEGYDPGKKFSPPAADDGYPPAERDTSFVCAVDRWGNCFAATPSDVNSTAPVIPGTGLIPSPRGSQSFEDPSHPACLAPGKRPRLTPNPAIIINPGRWAMPFGTPGSDVQVQAMVEVLLNIQLNKMSVQGAINAPRFATMSFPQTSTPHKYDRDLLLLEDGIPAAVGDHLANVGHMVKKWRDYDWRAGAVCAIKRDEKTGRLEGGADPRRPTGVAY